MSCATFAMQSAPSDIAPDAKKPASLAPKVVSFPTSDWGLIFADEYGQGDHAVVLVHGARFDKESWKDQALTLAQNKFRVLAINLRGYGKSRGGSKVTGRDRRQHLDVLGAAGYLRKTGAKTVSVIGASFGGWASAGASAESKPGEIDRLILLAAGSVDAPKRLKGRKLFIVSRNDGAGGRLPRIRKHYEQAPEPKELVILKGSAHAQNIFKTKHGEQLMKEILRFLSKP